MGKFFKSKAEKEQERKMLVKRSMKELEKRIAKLKEQEQVYINAARVAIREELPDQIKLATEALKMTRSEEKRTYKMLLNAQIISQMKDMTAMTNEFLGAIQVISKDIANTTTADMSKLTSELRMAMDKVSEQTENLGEMLEESQDTVSDFTATSNIVSDDEINALIYGQQTPGAQTPGATQIDDELAALKTQFNI
ncbi:MAG: hypothetical protein IJW66_01095 [Clostridia bacterium]|nr:hypothetical protein [Clostridia bacterium]